MREYKIKIKIKMTNRNSTHYGVLFGEDSIDNEISLENENDSHSCFCLDTLHSEYYFYFLSQALPSIQRKTFDVASVKNIFAHPYLEYSV